MRPRSRDNGGFDGELSEMTFAIDRRGVLGLMTSALATGAVFLAMPASADGLISAFAQALAAAAQDDETLAGFYRDRNYATLWTGPSDDARRRSLFAALDTAAAHGLPVARYDAAGLRRMFAAADTEGDLGRLELAASRALLAFARDLSSGALEPSSVSPGIKRTVQRPDGATVLAAAATGLLQPCAPRVRAITFTALLFSFHFSFNFTHFFHVDFIRSDKRMLYKNIEAGTEHVK